MNDPLVSVVVPTRNRAAFFARAVGAALDQAVDVEVVAVDEASSDETPTWLTDQTDPRLRWIRNEVAHGPGAARNQGIEVARGRWLAFCDDDDLWAPDKLSAQLAALGQHPEALWCASGAVHVDPTGRLIRADHPPATSDLADDMLRWNVVPGGGSGVLADARLVREVGAFDVLLRQSSDWDMWIRLALASPVASVDRPLVAYLEHPGNMSISLSGVDGELARLLDKYRVETHHRGVAIDRWQWNRWVADQQSRAGMRVAPAVRCLRVAAQEHDWHSILAAAGAMAAPRMTSAYRSRRSATRVPADWRAEVATWLPGSQA